MAKRTEGFSEDCRTWAGMVWSDSCAVESIVSAWRSHSHEMSRYDRLLRSDLFPASPAILREDLKKLEKEVNKFISHAKFWLEVWQMEQHTSMKENMDEEADDYEEED